MPWFRPSFALPAPRAWRYLIAAVWLVNGVLCKMLGLVPRHEAIVARFIGPDHAGPLTRLIGLAELGMAGWVLSRIAPRWCAGLQIAVVAVMNLLEAWRAPDLLLWGRANAGFAALFCLLVYWHTFGPAPAPGRRPAGC